MLRLANTICEKTDDATQAFILYKDMTVPGILERFYKKMQDRLGVMMTKADVTEIRDHGDRMVVACKNTLLGMDFDLDVDLVVLPTGLVPTTAKDVTVRFAYRQGPDFPDLELLTVSRTPTTSASPTRPGVPASTRQAACVSP